ncbi:hypothetical protein DFH27DRAFT_220904 [Peziza echinospora]|nr:hypothetical protein DFH27DRAFT_220904 [Peziza echinospora]
MVNAIRKPYREELRKYEQSLHTRLEQSPPFTGRFSDNHRNGFYTPSDTTVNDGQDDLNDEENESVPDATSVPTSGASTPRPTTLGTDLPEELSQKLQRLDALQRENSELKANTRAARREAQEALKELSTLKVKTSLTLPVRVAIKSTAWGDRFVQLDGTLVDSPETSGNGGCAAQKFIDSWETFEFIPHGDNIVSFKSTAWGNVYLRAHVRVKAKTNKGGGAMSAGYGCGPNEKFKLHKKGNTGVYALESVAFPGNYVRLDGGWALTVNLQVVTQNYETFHLILLP